MRSLTWGWKTADLVLGREQWTVKGGRKVSWSKGRERVRKKLKITLPWFSLVYVVERNSNRTETQVSIILPYSHQEHAVLGSWLVLSWRTGLMLCHCDNFISSTQKMRVFLWDGKFEFLLYITFCRSCSSKHGSPLKKLLYHARLKHPQMILQVINPAHGLQLFYVFSE